MEGGKKLEMGIHNEMLVAITVLKQSLFGKNEPPLTCSPRLSLKCKMQTGSEILTPKELSEDHYSRQFYHMKVNRTARFESFPKRIPLSKYTDVCHHTGNTVKHPYATGGRLRRDLAKDLQGIRNDKKAIARQVKSEL
jgi:hypothetical protein